jgi:choline dehydrogenase-like flavoprotein
MTTVSCDVLVIGSGAGGGTVAYELRDLPRQGLRVLVLEQGARFDDHEFTGRELEMAEALYAEGGAFLTAERTMTLAFGRAYGGSTVVYTGTSLVAPERVIRGWGVPGLTHTEIWARSQEYAVQNNVHLLEPSEINENNRLFVMGARAAGFHAEQFPLNLKGCLGSSLCNLGCPNAAKQGTHRVQLPAAEQAGVEVVTRAEVLRLDERCATVRVSARPQGQKGRASEWSPGEYRVHARTIVVSAGAVGSSALLLRSGLGRFLPRLGQGFTCHPAQILVGEHARPTSNYVGHPKSYFVDRAETERFVLETCMYFPFVTAKNLSGFGAEHSRIMRAFPRLQMILLLACDRAVPRNRITVDRSGNPVVHYHFTDAVVKALVDGTRAAARMFFGAGALRMHAPTADPPVLEAADRARVDQLIAARHFIPGTTSLSAAHLMGGCGMGTSAADSVTDSWGRVHGLPWLRIADSGLFPDALEINPYLTIMALAGRVAEGLVRDLSDA